MTNSILPQILVGCVTAIAFAASLRILFQVALAQRAKHRAHRLIVQRALEDSQIKELIRSASEGRFSRQELEHAFRAIEAELHALSAQDRSFVVEGLRQPSISGAKRYVSEVLSGVAA